MIFILTFFCILKMYKYVDIGYSTLILASLLVFVNYYNCADLEGFDNNEAIRNIASMYNSNQMIVKDLKVTGSLEVAGTSTLGSWKVRGDRIGIDGRGDMHLAADQWLRLKNFNTDAYNAQGFASTNLWAANAINTGTINSGSVTSSGAVTAGSIGSSGALTAGTITATGPVNTPNLISPKVNIGTFKLTDRYGHLSVARPDNCSVFLVRTDAKVFFNGNDNVPRGWGCGTQD